MHLSTQAKPVLKFRGTPPLLVEKKAPFPSFLGREVETVFAANRSSFVTRSSAIAEGPRDKSCPLKSCQLPHNSAVRQVLNKSKL